MNYQTLLFELKDGIAFITVNRPDKLNALNDQVMLELGKAAEQIATEAEIRGAILTGAGPKAFVAGADIGDLARQGPFDGKARAQRGQGVLRRLETCGKPVIAAINGFALGGGCELAMACHMRIASENAKFGQPEVKLGIAPGYGGTQRLPRIVGKGNALFLILTGEMIDAQEAHRMGLVSKVVPGAELLAATERPRPAPPTIAITLDKTTVQSRNAPAPPDTLTVTVRAADPDGIDSAWVQLDGDPPLGADGLLDPVLEGPFRVLVPGGFLQGTTLPVRVRARDVAGFEGERDTSVSVAP